MALARQSRYFNAHPYLAGVAIGALTRAELAGRYGLPYRFVSDDDTTCLWNWVLDPAFQNSDPDQRARIKADVLKGLPGWYNHYTAVGGDWSRMLVSGRGTYEGLTMDRVIASRTKGKDPAPDPLDVLFDILIEEGGSVPTVYAHHTEKDMRLALVQPWCSVGSDGAAYAVEGPLRRGNPHPRSFGTFPRVLAVYVRERKLLPLEEAVRKMTSFPARRLNLA